MRLFELRREVDESGVSGIGTVAQGVIFDNGWCALTWLTPHTSVAFYTDIEEVVAIHGHGGATRVVRIADLSRARHLKSNWVQDQVEGVWSDAIYSQSETAKYMRDQRDALVAMFEELEYD